MNRLQVLLLSLILLPASAALAQAPGSRKPNEGVKACDFITKSEAETVAGGPLQEASGGPYRCRFAEAGYGSGPAKRKQVIIDLSFSTADNPNELNDVRTAFMSDSTRKPLVLKELDFADGAIWAWTGGWYGTLGAVRNGRIRVQVTISGITEDAALAAAKTFAARSLGGAGKSGYAYAGAPTSGALQARAGAAPASAPASSKAAAAEPANIAASNTKTPSSKPDAVAGTGTGTKTLCDTLAAHPEDAGRLAGIAGVADNAIVPAAATKACLQAVQSAPATARYQFQLGRSYWAARKYGEALAAFLAAEEKEYAPAYFYLAQAYEQGLVEGEKTDLAFAKDLYRMAAAEGFPPALEILGVKGGLVVDDADDYVHADWMKALAAGDMAALNQDADKVWSYLSGMQDVLAEMSDEDADCQAQIDRFLFQPTMAQVTALLRQAARGQLSLSPLNQAAADDGSDDMLILLQDHGGCSGQEFKSTYATLRRFVKEHPKN